jgi:RNA polymerase sigma-70 factor (ECF subfamily)
MSDDAELLESVAAGSTQAMREVYDRYGDAVYRFARACLGDAFEAADVMHETMLFVWGHADRYEARSTLKTWLFSIARNKAIDRLRRTARLDREETFADVEDPALAPEQLLAAAQEAERLRACIAELGPAHRAAIHLAFFEELTYQEIAAIENCPVGTVKTRVMHAKRLLLRCLQRRGLDRR